MNTNKSVWEQSLLVLAGKRKPSQNLLKLEESGIKTLKDLLWILPLRIQQAPKISPFTEIEEDKIFLGSGDIVSINFTPAFGRRGKGKVQLFNGTCVVRDHQSAQLLNLKWFNTYPSMKKQLEAKDSLTFLGKVTNFRGTAQIVNPNLNPPDGNNQKGMLIEYPTVHTVPGNQVKNIIKKIPIEYWPEKISALTSEMEKSLTLISLNKAFHILHGVIESNNEQIEDAKERVKYEEFFINQLKVQARKSKNVKLKAPMIEGSESSISEYRSLFPYQLTDDQESVLDIIRKDLNQSIPMMRLVQGDVGCGKTTVAIISALLAIKANFQVAMMCPTEALATQHFETLQKILPEDIRIGLLLGSTKTKNKKETYQDLELGLIDFIIGTHSLIQDQVQFKNLGLCIIDEQHKFGVEQRQKLSQKGEGVHSLIMTATPIPRSLQLAQYGDLNVSTIRTMPSGRKGIKTRIVTPSTYEKYLSFIKTRMSIGEQIYVVVPAIEDSEHFNLNSVLSLEKTYQTYFPEYKIGILHGQLSSLEKQEIMDQFTEGEINLLISTTVIEVGINVINSTVISIYNPDRFGLSSLHQLRGRVGRGEKPGFCFLVTDDQVSKESMNRIKIIEKTLDGFEIAEADLKNRGQGDLFGLSQSGHVSSFKYANIINDFKLFEKVSKDMDTLKGDHTEFINQLLLNFIDDAQVSSTI